jgi:hypothetical protein
MVLSTLLPSIWFLLRLLDFGFGGSLTLTCGDVILTKETLSGVSATEKITCHSLLPLVPPYIWDSTFQLHLHNEIMVMASQMLFSFLYCTNMKVHGNHNPLKLNTTHQLDNYADYLKYL